MNALSEEQQRFLHRYVNNNGDFYGTVNSMGLDLSHISSWRQSNPIFEHAYNAAKQSVIEHLKDENYMMSLLKVNDALKNGVVQEFIQKRHTVGGTGGGEQDTEYEVTRTTKNLGVPAWAVRLSLEENSLQKAIYTLASEGVLPTPIARKLLQSANRIAAEIKESFDMSPDAEYINDKKAIALIKSAILGSSDE